MVQMAVVRDRAPVVLSPQCVGREFVRQYYTVLNQDPLKLHRFYTKHSRFLHGDSANGHSENPVMGQEAIYKKIQDLNFVDCRTKIRQVDSHSTLSEGVVVQVSGELSNNGQSMRRFMQTFVLAPGEDTRKYYVHNDIFRYQDEVFPEETSDETPDGTVDSEAEEESNNQVANGVTNYEQDSVHAQNAAQDVSSANLYYTDPVRNNSDSGSGLMQNQMMQEESQELQEIVVDKQLTEVTLNESAREMTDMKSEEVEEPEAGHLQHVSSDEAPSDGFRDSRDEEPIQESPKQEEKPKTWADMLGRSSGTPGMTVPPPKPQPKATPPRPAVVQPTVAKPAPPRDRPGFITKEARLAARNAPDDHQVFIGNLPNGVKDADVREVFSKYGAILEIRLNPKFVRMGWYFMYALKSFVYCVCGKGRSYMKSFLSGLSPLSLTNFGFVIFNSADPVKQILLDKPIKIGTHEINIEEKKPSGARREAPAAAGRGAAGGKGGGRGGGGGAGGRAAPGGTGAGGRGGGGFGGNQRGVRRSSGSSARGGKFANK